MSQVPKYSDISLLFDIVVIAFWLVSFVVFCFFCGAIQFQGERRPNPDPNQACRYDATISQRRLLLLSFFLVFFLSFFLSFSLSCFLSFLLFLFLFLGTQSKWIFSLTVLFWVYNLTHTRIPGAVVVTLDQIREIEWLFETKTVTATKVRHAHAQQYVLSLSLTHTHARMHIFTSILYSLFRRG